MSCQCRNTHPDKDRRAGRCHDAIVRRRRNAHSKNNAAQHRQKKCNDQPPVCDGNDGSDQFIGKARHGDAAGNDPRHAAGRRHRDGSAPACLQGIDALCKGDPVFLIKQADHNGEQNGIARRLLHRHIVAGHPDNQHHKRKQQINLPDQQSENRQLLLRDSGKPQLLRLQMDGNKNACKIQHRGKNRARNDVGIRNADKIRHQECRSAHDRRHDLSARRCRSLYRACKFRLIARLLHHRDCDRARCDRVSHRRPGHHAAERRGNDRNLGGTSRISAGRTVCKLNEEVRNSGPLQECTENNEHDNVLRAYIDRCGENPLLCIEQIPDKIPHAPEEGWIGQPVRQCINQEKSRNTQDGKANAPSRQLNQHRNSDHADDDLEGLEPCSLIDDPVGVKGKIKERSRPKHRQQNVIPGHVIGSGIALLCRIGKKSHQYNQRQKGGQADLLQKGCKQGDINAPKRKCRKKHADRLPVFPGPDANVGFPVVFLHNGIHIRGYRRLHFTHRQSSSVVFTVIPCSL